MGPQACCDSSIAAWGHPAKTHHCTATLLLRDTLCSKGASETSSHLPDDHTVHLCPGNPRAKAMSPQLLPQTPPFPPPPSERGSSTTMVCLTHVLSCRSGYSTSRSSSQQPSTHILAQLLSSPHLKALTTSEIHRVLWALLLNHPQLHN